MTADQQDNSEDEDAIKFVTYIESDDDDEDPFYMPEHNRKFRTLYLNNRFHCSPIQLIRFFIPALCILTIIMYTTSLLIMMNNKKNMSN